MTDTTDPVRAAFENWAEANGFVILRDDSEKYRDYHRATTRWAWMAWQAALSAPPYDLIQQMRSFLLAHRPDDGSPVDKQFGKMLEVLSAPPAENAITMVHTQAEDDGLWFNAQTAAEGYLQQELRRLHAAVEKDSAMKNGEAL